MTQTQEKFDAINDVGKIPVNFQYKSRLFEMIFSQPEELLELYNAVNGSNYTDPQKLEVNTLKKCAVHVHA